MTSPLCDQKAGSYGEIWPEYYDNKKHPTCANFRELSLRFIVEYVSIELTSSPRERSRILETGAGLTVFSETALRNFVELHDLSIQDNSEGMLSHSELSGLQSHGRFISDARSLPSADFAYDLIVSSLADPYNDAQFWTEIARVIDRKGLWILTTPSNDWAKRFRIDGEKKRAEFILSNGTYVSVPSYTYDVDYVVNSIANLGGRLEAYRGLHTSTLDGDVSPKIVLADEPIILDCFAFRF